MGELSDPGGSTHPISFTDPVVDIEDVKKLPEVVLQDLADYCIVNWDKAFPENAV